MLLLLLLVGESIELSIRTLAAAAAVVHDRFSPCCWLCRSLRILRQSRRRRCRCPILWLWNKIVAVVVVVATADVALVARYEQVSPTCSF